MHQKEEKDKKYIKTRPYAGQAEWRSSLNRFIKSNLKYLGFSRVNNRVKPNPRLVNICVLAFLGVVEDKDSNPIIIKITSKLGVNLEID